MKKVYLLITLLTISGAFTINAQASSLNASSNKVGKSLCQVGCKDIQVSIKDEEHAANLDRNEAADKSKNTNPDSETN